MSKLLKRALRTAVLPASLIVAGKFLSIITLVGTRSLEFSVNNDAPTFFSIQLVLSNHTDALMVNSVSNLVTLLLIAIPTFYMLVRRTLLVDIQNNPRTVVKLTKLNVLKWVTNQNNPLLDVLVWVMFLWIISAICISSAISLETYSWIGVVSGTFALLSAWGLLRTFEAETAKIYPKDNNGYL